MTGIPRWAILLLAAALVLYGNRNKPFAEIRPLQGGESPRKRRTLGLMKGLCPVGAEFFVADGELADSVEDSRIFPESPMSPS